MGLFDEIERHHTGPAQHTEGMFSFLNRSARSDATCIRTVLEEWFSHIPREEAAPFRHRLREGFDAAFFELLLHEMLLRLGYRVFFHPIADPKVSKRPDFLAERADGEAFFLEAIAPSDMSQKERSQVAARSALYDEIGKMRSPNFFLHIEQIVMPKRGAPSGKWLRRELESWLSQADPDEIAMAMQGGRPRDAVPRWVIRRGEFEVVVRPLPKRPEARGKGGSRPIGMYPAESRWGGSASTLRRAILEKASRYGTPNRSYVIAANVVSWAGTDRIDITEALFGPELFALPTNGPPVFAGRGDGAWHSKGKPRGTRTSAVLVATVHPANVPRAQVWVCHNPWAAKSLTGDALPLPQVVPRGERLDWVEGRSLGDILGLAPDWPCSS